MRVKKKNKSRKCGRTCQVRGGRGERGAVVGNRVVTKGLTGKVIWLRNAKVWVPDNFNIPFFQTIFAAKVGEYRSSVCYFYCTCELTLLFML